MAITKTTTKSIKDASVEEVNINNCAATNTKLGADAVTSAKINNGTVVGDDLASTLDLSSKSINLASGAVTADSLASTLDLSSKTLTLPDTAFEKQYANIGLLGFKMAVNESLTVFNLVDGVVDEFNDESGTDEAEGTNDLYNATDDYYINSTSPDGTPPSTATSATIVSETFSSIGTPTTSRIVVFEEDIDTPTLNTDIIASVSRDGTNFTNATLSDSGYVTGSSGQRILTGQADISGQPSGQSMRWKLQLANNQVKIHGVSLSWA